jgi:tetratricopeptide (TPR) repeat protein
MHRYYLGLCVLALCSVTACNWGTSKEQYVETGNRFYDQKKFKDAALAYRKAIQKDENFGEAYLRLGLAEMQIGRLPRAVPALQRAVMLLPKREEPKVKLADIYLQVYAADARKPKQALEKAKELASDLLSKEADSSEGLRLSGHIALIEGDPEKAISLLEKANIRSPHKSGIIVPLIQALFRANQVPEGEKAGRDAIAADPSLSGVYDLLFLQYMKDGKVAEAESIIQRKLANAAKDSAVVLQLAAFYFSTGKTSQMESALEPLRGRPADFPRGRLELGDFYARIGKPEESMREYQAGMQANPKEEHEYQKRMAALLLAKGEREGAVKLFDAVLKKDPENADVLIARATVWSQSGDPVKISAAIEEFRRLIGRDPENPLLYLQLGRVYMRRGDIPGGRTEFEEAVRRQRWLVPARLALAEVAIVEGNYREALQQISEALSVDARNITARLLKATALTGERSLIQARSELNALLRETP